MRLICFLICLLWGSTWLWSQKGSDRNQFAYYICSDPMIIDSTLLELEANKVFFNFNTDQSPGQFTYEDYKWDEGKSGKYFEAFLINTSDSTLTLERQDASLVIIQEALDENGNWEPIEYWVDSGCGNSYLNPVNLSPGKYIIVPIRKYKGEFKTRIRLRYKYFYRGGEGIMISDSFEGSIDKSQFQKQTENVHGILYHGPANYLKNK